MTPPLSLEEVQRTEGRERRTAPLERLGFLCVLGWMTRARGDEGYLVTPHEGGVR